MAAALDMPEPQDAAPRPAPRPPVEARPQQISVTTVQTLIRDPYAVYARRILGLDRLGSLAPEPGAPLRGQVLHKVFDRFTEGEAGSPSPDPAA